mgnify:CR=1 FL=1
MVFFLLTCLLMILVILLQPGKSDIAALGGGGGFMGGGGATSFLTKLTSGLAITYMIMVIVLGKRAVGTFTEVREAQSTVDITTTPAAADSARGGQCTELHSRC